MWLDSYSRSGHPSRWIATEVSFSCGLVTQELICTLWLVGTIGRHTDPPVGNIPSFVDSRLLPEMLNVVQLPEHPPPSRPEYPPHNVPGYTQEGALTDARGSTSGYERLLGLEDAIVRWRHKVPEQWDPFNEGNDSTQEVSDD